MTKRFSNFELLRLFSIFLIVSFHCVYHSGLSYATFSFNVFIVKTFYLFGELGVNLFLLISGYFNINGKFKPKKLIYLILELIFYVLLSKCIVGILLNNLSLSMFNPLNILFSIVVPEYWFFSAYVLLYIFSPFINLFIKSMNKKYYFCFLLLSLIVYCFIPTLLGVFRAGDTEVFNYFNRFIWAIIIYCTGAFLSQYSFRHLTKLKNNILIAVFSFLTMLLCIVFIGVFQPFDSIGLTEPAYFWRMNTIPMVLLSISVFNIFAKLRIKPNKIINLVASTTLGIYLLTDGELRPIIWGNAFDTANNLGKTAGFSLLFILGTSIISIIIGVLIDLLRQIIEKYTVRKLLNNSKIDMLGEYIKTFIMGWGAKL